MGPEWVATLISAVGVLFDRIEHQEDKLEQQVDLIEPLLELYRLVGEWERFAEVTNVKLAQLAHASTPDELYKAAQEAIHASGPQTARVYDVAFVAGVDTDLVDTPEFRDKLDLRDLISIYAPDLEDSFRQIVKLRLEQLRFLQEVANKITSMDNRKVDAHALAEVVIAWTDDYPRSFGVVTEQNVRDFEYSKTLLAELRRKIALFIRTHWDPKDITI